jgi:hypothetical protein
VASFTRKGNDIELQLSSEPAGQMPPFPECFFSSKNREQFAILTKQKKVNDVHLLRRERHSWPNPHFPAKVGKNF